MKKLWNIQATIIPIVIGAFGTVTKGLLKGLEDGWRPSKPQYYWERPEYREDFWRLEVTCCQSDFSEIPSANADVKRSNNNNNNKSGQKTRPNNKWTKKSICKIFDLAVLDGHKIKLIECVKKDKYLDFGRELKK